MIIYSFLFSFVKMGIVLTTSEDMISEAEKKKQEDLIMK